MYSKRNSDVLDVVIHLHSFRNIDARKGLYVIRVGVKAGSIQGTPYAYFTNPMSQSSFVKDQEIDIPIEVKCPCARIGRNGATSKCSNFISRGFVISYREERLELNEGCQFQLRVPQSTEQRLEISFELFLAEIKGDSSNANQNIAASTATKKDVHYFSRLAYMSLYANVNNSLHAYYPITFTNFNFCQLDVTMHVALLKSSDEKAIMRSLGAISIALQSMCDMGLSSTPTFEQGPASCAVLWSMFVSILPQHKKGGHMRIAGRLRRTWVEIERRYWLQFITTSSLKIQKLLQAEDEKAQNLIFAGTKLRLVKPEAILNTYDPRLLADDIASALCHQTIYSRGESIDCLHDSQSNNLQNISQKGPHLIVLQHGWFATCNDMRLIQSYVKLLFPKAIVFNARSNQENSSLPIAIMGERLADEIQNYVTRNCPALGNANPNYGRISFIGHSIGSIIIRAAISTQIFHPFRPKLHTFITLNSSHCGNKYLNSTLISSGIWTIMQMQKTSLLEQLQLADADAPEKSYIFKLSQEPGLELFKQVVLVATRQDSYVPIYSAHIHVPLSNSQLGGSSDMFINMVRNILSPVIGNPDIKIIRLTLDIDFKAQNLNTLIGRAGHIALLENPKLILLLLFGLCDTALISS